MTGSTTGTAYICLITPIDGNDAHAVAAHCASDTTPQTAQICSSSGVDTAGAIQAVREHVATFAAPYNGRAACVVGLTFALWLGTLALNSWWFKQSQAHSTWWGLLLSGLFLVARSGAFVRASMVVHDGNHYALFTSRCANEWAAFLAGVITGTDAADWRRSHAQHHAVLGIEVSMPGAADCCTYKLMCCPLQPQCAAASHVYTVAV